MWSDPVHGLKVSRYDNIDGDLTAIIAVLVGGFIYISDEAKVGKGKNKRTRCPRADGRVYAY